MLDWLVSHGSLPVVFLALVAAGCGAPLPEEICFLAAGALSLRGVGPAAAFAACVAGALTGDVTAFLVARRLGQAARARGWLARVLTARRREQAESLVRRRGGLLVLLLRQVPGIRMPTFAVLATHGMGLVRFLLWDACALAVSLNVWFWLGRVFGEEVGLLADEASLARHVVLAAAATAALACCAVCALRARSRRRERGEGAGLEGHGH